MKMLNRRIKSLFCSLLGVLFILGLFVTSEVFIDKEEREMILVELMVPGTQEYFLPEWDDNQLQDWLSEEFGIELKLSHPIDFQAQVMLRFSSGSVPDILAADYTTVLNPLYQQGMLLQDWEPYLDKLPTIKSNMTSTAKEVLSVDGKLSCLSDSAQPRNKSLKIRVDWLENLGLSKPETPEELLKVAYEMTYSDPDRDGKKNTYAFTSAGYGVGFGDMLESFQCMWGPPDFYVDGDEISHPMLDGNRKKFLDFVKYIVEQQLIDPDWYTQGEEGMQYYLSKTGQIGIAYDSGAILSRAYEMNHSDEAVIGWWDNLVMPRESHVGGKQEPNLPYVNTRTVSRDAFKNPDKRDAVLAFLDQCSYPNNGYWHLRWGKGLEELEAKGTLIDLGENDFRYLWYDVEGQGVFSTSCQLSDYGNWVANQNDRVVVSSLPIQDNPIVYSCCAMSDQANKLPAYGNMILNATYQTEDLKQVQAVQAEYELKYVTGELTDFEEYKQEWLKAGGQNMLSEAKRQALAGGLLD